MQVKHLLPVFTILLISTPMVSLMTNNQPLLAQQTAKRISFKPSTTSIILADNVEGKKVNNYILDAKAGQKI